MKRFLITKYYRETYINTQTQQTFSEYEILQYIKDVIFPGFEDVKIVIDLMSRGILNIAIFNPELREIIKDSELYQIKIEYKGRRMKCFQ